MTILYFLVPLALMLAGLAAFAFRWAAYAEQFEDLESPAIRMLDETRGVDAELVTKESRS